MSRQAAAELTVDRLFAAPALAGPAVLEPKISPDARRVTWLRGQDGDNNRLDLWECELATLCSRKLVDSSALPTAEAPLSDEEAARRERQRTASLRGILDYAFEPGGESLIFRSDGSLFRYGFGAGEITPLTRPEDAQTDVQMSPAGAVLAFVRDQNIVVLDLASRAERTLTHDGGGTIKNGMAEFIAQEEMDRSTGHWWSPDGARIAFAQVDESSVPLRQRFEIRAADMTAVEQRYPAAGERNATVRIGVIAVRGGELDDGAVRWMDLGAETDVYIARVDWLPDGRTLAVQRQSRDQRRLDLLFADTDTGATRLVLSESSPCWIDLHDELTFLRHAPQFVWASSRDGFRHLYLHDLDGRPIRRLTEGPWMVEDFRARAVKCVDEKNRMIYFAATRDHPGERHLYTVSLDAPATRDPRRITREPGIHSITMTADASCYIDQFSSPSQPPQTGIHWFDGRKPAWLSENPLNETHPYIAYLGDESRPTFGTLSASDGTALHYRLYAPARLNPGGGHPAIVDVYGGPGAQRVVKNWSGGSFTQVLTRAGYFVLQLDNRGSAGRGEAFKAAIRGRLGAAEVDDQIQGAEWLAHQPGVDPARIGVWGWSYGGYMALMLMCRAGQRFRAGIAGAPVTDWTLYDTHYTERFLGTPSDNPNGYEQSSVLAHAAHLSGPLLVMHGMADDNVLFAHSTKLFQVLQRLNKPFEIMAYPGGKHGLTRTEDGRHAYMTIKRFFDRNL